MNEHDRKIMESDDWRAKASLLHDAIEARDRQRQSELLLFGMTAQDCRERANRRLFDVICGDSVSIDEAAAVLVRRFHENPLGDDRPTDVCWDFFPHHVVATTNDDNDSGVPSLAIYEKERLRSFVRWVREGYQNCEEDRLENGFPFDPEDAVMTIEEWLFCGLPYCEASIYRELKEGDENIGDWLKQYLYEI